MKRLLSRQEWRPPTPVPRKTPARSPSTPAIRQAFRRGSALSRGSPARRRASSAASRAMRLAGSSCFFSIRVISGVSRSQAPSGDQTRERRGEWRAQAAGISSTTVPPSRQRRQKPSTSVPRLLTTPAPVRATRRSPAAELIAAASSGHEEVHHGADGGQAGDVLVLQRAAEGILELEDE